MESSMRVRVDGIVLCLSRAVGFRGCMGRWFGTRRAGAGAAGSTSDKPGPGPGAAAAAAVAAVERADGGHSWRGGGTGPEGTGPSERTGVCGRCVCVYGTRVVGACVCMTRVWLATGVFRILRWTAGLRRSGVSQGLHARLSPPRSAARAALHVPRPLPLPRPPHYLTATTTSAPRLCKAGPDTTRRRVPGGGG